MYYSHPLNGNSVVINLYNIYLGLMVIILSSTIFVLICVLKYQPIRTMYSEYTVIWLDDFGVMFANEIKHNNKILRCHTIIFLRLGLMKHNITVDMEHNNIEGTSQYFLTEALVYLIIVTNSVRTLTIHIYCHVFVGMYGIKIFFFSSCNLCCEFFFFFFWCSVGFYSI